jgi:hypothetical protein
MSRFARIIAEYSNERRNGSWGKRGDSEGLVLLQRFHDQPTCSSGSAAHDNRGGTGFQVARKANLGTREISLYTVPNSDRFIWTSCCFFLDGKKKRLTLKTPKISKVINMMAMLQYSAICADSIKK